MNDWGTAKWYPSRVHATRPASRKRSAVPAVGPFGSDLKEVPGSNRPKPVLRRKNLLRDLPPRRRLRFEPPDIRFKRLQNWAPHRLRVERSHSRKSHRGWSAKEACTGRSSSNIRQAAWEKVLRDLAAAHLIPCLHSKMFADAPITELQGHRGHHEAAIRIEAFLDERHATLARDDIRHLVAHVARTHVLPELGDPAPCPR